MLRRRKLNEHARGVGEIIANSTIPDALADLIFTKLTSDAAGFRFSHDGRRYSLNVRELVPSEEWFGLEIDTGNAAFAGRDGPAEVARILRRLADEVEIESGLTIQDGTKLFDVNGNTVGRVTVRGKRTKKARAK